MRHKLLISVLTALFCLGATFSSVGAAGPHAAKPSKTKPGKNSKPTKPKQHKPVFVPTLVPVPPGWPQVVSIPKIGVKAPIESLPLNTKKQLDAPFKWGDVVWYNKSAKPGNFGRASIFGHLDSYCCPAIFYRLKLLKPGDNVYVRYKTGPLLTFRVMWTGLFWNSKLPLRFIYGATWEHGMVLMTCGGVFHRDGTGYDHRLVVYTREVYKGRVV